MLLSRVLSKGENHEARSHRQLERLGNVIGIEAANAQAEINPNLYPTYRGAPVAEQPWEWYSTPGPVRRGGQCVADVDPGRGYGYMKDCPARGLRPHSNPARGSLTAPTEQSSRADDRRRVADFDWRRAHARQLFAIGAVATCRGSALPCGGIGLKIAIAAAIPG